MSRPISKRMLTCSATLYTKETDDYDRVTEWSEGISLTGVYITTTRQQSNGSQGKQPSDSMMLYYDCFNSRPLGLTFEKGSKVEFDGFVYYINSITPCYTDGLHHFEIGLN